MTDIKQQDDEDETIGLVILTFLVIILPIAVSIYYINFLISEIFL